MRFTPTRENWTPPAKPFFLSFLWRFHCNAPARCSWCICLGEITFMLMGSREADLGKVLWFLNFSIRGYSAGGEFQWRVLRARTQTVCEAPPVYEGSGLRLPGGHSLCSFSAPSWCLEQTASHSRLQVRRPASVLTRTDTIENCIRRQAIGICSKYITEHKWLADTACLAVCKGNGSMDFWIRREGLFFPCAGTSSWWLGRKLI